MLRFIENLRSKPDRTKKQFALLVAFTFAGLIFVVWLSVFYPDWKRSNDKERAASKLEPGPIDSLTGIISNGVSSISDTIDEAKDVIGSISTTTATSTDAQ